MRKSYPDYSYREATLNPTNLIDRADDWEADLVRYFADHPNDKKLIGERETPTGRYLYLAKPMVAKASCLECHSTPDVAPAAMIKTYGPQNGFGWKLNQVIAAQIVAVPMSLPIQVADQAYRNLIFFLIATFLLTIAALDTALYLIVIRPLHQVSQAADRISKGETESAGPSSEGPRRNCRRDRLVQPHAREPGEGAEDAGVVECGKLRVADETTSSSPPRIARDLSPGRSRRRLRSRARLRMSNGRPRV